jgi:hypothetical protein
MSESRSVKRKEMVFQFLIVLVGVDPLVWRRIRVIGGIQFLGSACGNSRCYGLAGLSPA